MMKKTLVVLLALVMVFALASTAMAADTQYEPYADIVDMDNADHQTAIERLSVLGALKGYNAEGTVFAPNQLITREEFATVAVRLAGLEDQVALYASFAPAFADVPDGYWSEGYINTAKDNGIMIGRSATVFDRTSNVTMQEVVTVALRVLGYDSRLPGEWPAEYNNKAVAVGLAKYVDFVGPKHATRAEVASLVNQALDLYMVKYVDNSVAQGIGQAVGLFASNFDDDFYGVLGSNQYLGLVDADGYTYVSHMTNESDVASKIPLIYSTFDAYVTYGIFDDGGSVMSETTGWGFADVEDWELEFYFYPYDGAGYEDGVELIDEDEYYAIEVASTYGISHGGMVVDLGWQEAAMTVYDQGETRKGKRIGDEVAYVEFLGEVERIYDAEDDLELDDDFLWLGWSFIDEGDYGEAWYDEAGDLYATKNFDIFAEAIFGIVDSSTATAVNFKETFPEYARDALSSSPLAGERLNLNRDDYVFFLMGEGFIDAEDLEAGDVIYLETESLTWPVPRQTNPGLNDFYSMNDDVEVGIVFRAELGALSKLQQDSVTIDGEKYGAQANIFEDEWDNSFYSWDLGRTIFNYDGAAVQNLNWSTTVMWVPSYAFVNFAYVIDDFQHSALGVLDSYIYADGKKYLDISAAASTTLVGMNIMTADGDMIEVDFDKSITTFNALAANYWEEGSLVEYYVNEDGEFLDWVEDPDFGDMLGYGFNEGLDDFDIVSAMGVFANNGNLTLFYTDISDAITGDSWKAVADDAVVFLVETHEDYPSLYAFDSVEVISGEELTEAGNFNAADVEVYENSGSVPTMIWIKDYEAIGDEEFGFGLYTGDYGQAVVDGDNYYFVTVGGTDFIIPEDIAADAGFALGGGTALVFYRVADGELQSVDDIFIVDAKGDIYSMTVAQAALFDDIFADLGRDPAGIGYADLLAVTDDQIELDDTALKVQAYNYWSGADTLIYDQAEDLIAYDMVKDEAIDLDDLEDHVGKEVIVVYSEGDVLEAILVVSVVPVY